MQVHSNSATTPVVRRIIHTDSSSRRAMAQQFGIAASTVQRWKGRDSVADRSSRPKKLRCAMTDSCKDLALRLRRKELTLDQCHDALKEEFPELSRSTLHRFLASQGLGRLWAAKKKAPGKFKSYKPGFLHIDHFYLPALGAKKRYCFIAIDRCTRLAFLKVYDQKTTKASKDFLERALAFFPFTAHRLLSDNGPEFTNRRYKRAPGGAKTVHPLDAICKAHGIDRRFTKPYTPATNGMAERFVGLCKQATVSTHRYKSHQQLERELGHWIRRYNLSRPHGGIARKTPFQQAAEWYKQDPSLFSRDPALLKEVFLTY